MDRLHQKTVLNIYYGFDEREEIGSHVWCSSVIHRSSMPVALIPLHLNHFRSFYSAGHRDGTNAFILTRYLIPFLQDFNGWAVFADGADMICLGDVAELYALRDYRKAVQVVPHVYATKHPRKYIGTKMEADNVMMPRKNWSSVMLINCGHTAWRQFTPEFVQETPSRDLHRFSHIDDRFIGALPPEWNWLCQEDGPNPDAKIIHWTLGTPAFSHYANDPHADLFRQELARTMHITD